MLEVSSLVNGVQRGELVDKNRKESFGLLAFFFDVLLNPLVHHFHVFLSCGDYASGTNHTLPTYGFARQYSGVSTSTFEKHITSQNLTREGLMKLGPHVVHLAECEGLEAHANAVRLRLKSMQ